MATLNINQYVERANDRVNICKTCGGKLNEVPLKIKDTLQVIFGKSKIVNRFVCSDCFTETKIEK